MTEWKAPFKQGVFSFRVGKHQDAIASFSEALRLGGDEATICDARASVYQKQGKLKEALRDAKAVIDSQPGRWQGYARSARLFSLLRKFDAASRMIDLALERIPTEQLSRRDEMLALQREVESSREQAVIEAARVASLRAYHFGKLPIEIANTMFSLVLAEDPAYAVVLAQVCKNWRSAILSTPSFWSSLVVKSSHPARKIKVWKERSKNRIRELVLTDDFSAVPSVIEELGKLSLKSLVALRLDNFPIDKFHVHLPSIDDQCLQAIRGWHQGSATSLSGELRWDDKTPYFSPHTLDLTSHSGLRIDWDQLSSNLTELRSWSFDGFSGQLELHHVLWLLHRNSDLAELHIHRWRPPNGDTPPDREVPPTIVMPRLSAIKIMASIPERLLTALSFPSLRSLDLSVCQGTLNGTLRHLADGKVATLTSLAIRTSTFSPRLLVHTLATMPLLETLELVAIGDDAVGAVLEALARPPPSLPIVDGAAVPDRASSPVYCPALRTLNCSHNQTLRGGVLVRLVKLRITEAEKYVVGTEEEVAQNGTSDVKPLERLIVDGCPMLDSDVLPWLREKVPSVSCIYMTKKASGWKR